MPDSGSGGEEVERGQMYAAGIAVRKDPIRAHMWLSVAAIRGHEGAARLRDTLALSMTRRDIFRAGGLAQACIESGRRRCGL